MFNIFVPLAGFNAGHFFAQDVNEGLARSQMSETNLHRTCPHLLFRIESFD